MAEISNETTCSHPGPFRCTYAVTGAAAAQRIVPLVSDVVFNSDSNESVHSCAIFESDPVPSPESSEACTQMPAPLFLWENARRKTTRSWRNRTKCYSHIPSASSILDDKWKFALLSQSMECPTLRTVCLKGAAFEQWAKSTLDEENDGDNQRKLWFLKDAATNGAGAVWLISSRNWRDIAGAEGCFRSDTRLIVQEHVPGRMRLWKGRKVHIRAYALLTSDGAAYVHRKCFSPCCKQAI